MKGHLYCPRCKTPFEPRQLQISGDEAHVRCPACGESLSYSLSSGSDLLPVSDDSTVKTESFAARPDLAAQWEQIRNLPTDSPEHDSFLELCFRKGALHDLAGAYRTIQTDDPKGVAKRLRQIEILATMTMTPATKKRVQAKRLGKWIFYVLLALFLVLFMWVLMATPY